MREGRLLGQELADLEVRVHSFLQPAEQLQQQGPSVRHRRVALLRLNHRRVGPRIPGADQAPEGGCGGGHQPPGAPREASTPGHSLEEGTAEARIDERVVQKPLAPGGLEPRHSRESRWVRSGPVAGNGDEREDVPLGVSFRELDVDERKVAGPVGGRAARRWGAGRGGSGGRDRYRFDDLGALESPALAPEPAAGIEVARAHVR